MKTLFVHIGAGKCGSSAVQSFLGTQQHALSDRGLRVASQDLSDNTTVTGNQVWFFEHLEAAGAPAQKRARERVRQLLDQDGCDGLILSAENMSNLRRFDSDQPYAFPDIFRGLDSEMRVVVVVYIRRQDELLLSAWQQWFLKSHRDFWEWVERTTETKHFGDWRGVIEAWSEVGDVIPRVYDRGIGDVVSEFKAILGIAAAELPYQVEANPSFNLGVQSLVEGRNFLFDGSIHDNGFYSMVVDLTQDRHLKKPGEPGALTPEERLSILSSYEADNAWVRSNFFPDLPRETLFSAPDPLAPVATAGEIAAQREALVADLVYSLYQRIADT